VLCKFISSLNVRFPMLKSMLIIGTTLKSPLCIQDTTEIGLLSVAWPKNVISQTSFLSLRSKISFSYCSPAFGVVELV